MRVTALLVACLAAACADAAANKAAPRADPPQAELPRGAIVLGAADLPAMLRQCSRQAPAPGEGSWQPAAADILALEAALPAELARQSARNVDWSHWPRDWRRQYVGIIRGGRRFIYGNFVPSLADRDGGTAPIVICDGGPTFFGAEYDVAAGRFSQIAFNGAI